VVHAFRGPGISDNGAGLAALLAVARAWKFGQALPAFPRGLLLAANVGEEGEGNLLGMRHLCKQSAIGKQIGRSPDLAGIAGAIMA
jgi:tripeptide aminopeptidase